MEYKVKRYSSSQKQVKTEKELKNFLEEHPEVNSVEAGKLRETRSKQQQGLTFPGRGEKKQKPTGTKPITWEKAKKSTPTLNKDLLKRTEKLKETKQKAAEEHVKEVQKSISKHGNKAAHLRKIKGIRENNKLGSLIHDSKKVFKKNKGSIGKATAMGLGTIGVGVGIKKAIDNHKEKKLLKEYREQLKTYSIFSGFFPKKK